MKKLTLLLTTLVFSLTMMFSFPSYAEWTEYGENVYGDTFYLDFERIRKHGGYVYFWRLDDYPKPSKYGTLSVIVYSQGDCKLFRYKQLSFSFYKEPMGGGDGGTFTPPNEWKYPSPDSVFETTLKKVCEYAN